jgi:hypothetical protein
MDKRCVAVLATLAIGCVGAIGPSGGPSGGAPGGGGIPGAPELSAIAAGYFPGQMAANPPKRVSRLTRTQLDLTTKTLLPAHYKTAVLGTLPPDPLQTNYEYSANLSFNPTNFTPYTNWVDQIVASVRANPGSVINCAAADPACLQAEAKKFVARAFRGTVTDTQLGRYSTFLTTSATQVGLPAATADLVAVTLTSPNYVFRDEVLADGTGLLLPAERLQNLSYTLADAPPETVGLSSVTPGAALLTPNDVQTTVDRILATPEARAKLLRFFSAWLEIREPSEFTIAPTSFPEFTPAVAAAVVEEARAFLSYQLSKAAPTLKDVTQSTQSFVSNALGSIYGINTPDTTKLVDLDPAQRLGVFTLPGVIASHSGPTTTRVVKRGVFFTRKVMCLPLGQPPAGVDTSIPSTAVGTERQKVESVTRASPCAGCHTFINPFGFMQENYDAIGRWRTTDNGFPIDANISVNFLDEGPLNTSTPVDALKGFTSSMRFKQCFVRQLFRFYMGRDEVVTDDPLLKDMFLTFATNDSQGIVELLRALANSSGFSQRSEAP